MIKFTDTIPVAGSSDPAFAIGVILHRAITSPDCTNSTTITFVAAADPFTAATNFTNNCTTSYHLDHHQLYL